MACAMVAAAPGLHHKGLMTDMATGELFHIMTDDERMTVEEAQSAYIKRASANPPPYQQIWYNCTNLYAVGVGGCTHRHSPSNFYQSIGSTNLTSAIVELAGSIFGTHTQTGANSGCLVARDDEQLLCVNTDMANGMKLHIPWKTRHSVATFAELACQRDGKLMSSRFTLRLPGFHGSKEAKQDMIRYVNLCLTDRLEKCVPDETFCPLEMNEDGYHANSEYRQRCGE